MIKLHLFGTGLLLLSSIAHAQQSIDDASLFSEVKNFWVAQLDGGEAAVIEKVKSCYVNLNPAPKQTLRNAEICIILDTALSSFSESVSLHLGEQFGKRSGSIQTSYANKASMTKRATTLLGQYGLNADEASAILKNISMRVADVFSKGYSAANKIDPATERVLNGITAADVKKIIAHAEGGDALGQLGLGLLYLRGEGVSQDTKEAAKWIQLAADQGNADGQLMLGTMFFEGIGFQKDYVRATALFRLSAEQGNAKAQHNYAANLRNGHGVEKDLSAAVTWFRKAADQDIVESQIVLWRAYSIGEGVPKNEVEAIKWLRQAAFNGHSSAQNALGDALKLGKGLPQNYKEAVRWHTEAAEQGHTEAQYNLGLDYAKGLGVLQDDKEASKWFHLAAEKGHAGALLMLGLSYEAGSDGVPRSLPVAYAMFSLAVLNSPSERIAMVKRDAVYLKLSHDETLLAQALSKEMAKPSNFNKSLMKFLEGNALRNKSKRISG